MTDADVAMSLTVVVPTHRQRPELLQRAVRSVHATCPGARCLVVVDREQDYPPPLLPAQILQSPGAGISAALNAGIREAESEFVAFLDSDDEWLPGKLDQVRGMLALGSSATFTDYRRGPDHVFCVTPLRRLFVDNIMCRSTTIVRREVLLAAGLFDEQLTWCQDWEMHCRIQHLTGWTRVPRPLARIANLATGHTRSAPSGERSRIRAIVANRWRHYHRGQVPTWEPVKP